MVEVEIKGLGTRQRPSTLSLPKQLDAAELLARHHGLQRAAYLIGAERMRRFPIRDWEYGACAWCETEGKRRKATHLNIGTGTPECDQHGCGDEETELLEHEALNRGAKSPTRPTWRIQYERGGLR